MFKQYIFATISFFCLIFLLILTLWQVDAQGKITIAQFGKERFLLYLPLYIAMEEGVFAKHGLDVDLKFAGLDDQVFATVISGEAQFGVGDPVFTAISHDKGGPGKVVALMITKLTNVGVTNLDKVHDIKKPKDLDGLRISSFPEPSTTFTLLDGIKRNNKLNLQIVQAPIDGQSALLETGKVDIALALEPGAAILEEKGYRSVFDLAPWAEPLGITGITVTEDYIKSHPQTVQKVVDSLQETISQMYSNPEASYRVGKKMYPNLSDKVVRKAVDRMLHDGAFPHSVAVADDVWQRTLKTRLDSGELKKPQATSVAVDNSFAMKSGKSSGVAK